MADVIVIVFAVRIFCVITLLLWRSFGGHRYLAGCVWLCVLCAAEC